MGFILPIGPFYCTCYHLNMIFRGYTFNLYPTPMQEEKFLQTAGVCRLIWNLALEQRQSHWRNFQARTGNNLNFVTQSRELTRLRAECAFVKEVSQTAEQFVLQHLERAFQSFFRGEAKFPCFKRKGLKDSFTQAGREIQIQRLSAKWANIKIPKIGWVKCRITRELKGKIAEATISRAPLGWQISLCCKIEDDRPKIEGSVGIDRGVTVPVMLSDGTSYSLPEQINLLDRRIRKAQRKAARRKRGSVRHAKAMKHVARLRAKQARVRKHWAHETTTAIARKFGTVVIERLRTKDMTKSAKGTIEAPGKNVPQKRGLNRSILNVGWHQLEQMLFYKALRIIKVDPAYTSQTCSCCGTVDKRSRESQASFVCTACGFRANADHNAAINILQRGNTPFVEVALEQPVKRELHKETTSLEILVF